jgi:hypothetical protein
VISILCSNFFRFLGELARERKKNSFFLLLCFSSKAPSCTMDFQKPKRTSDGLYQYSKLSTYGPVYIQILSASGLQQARSLGGELHQELKHRVDLERMRLVAFTNVYEYEVPNSDNEPFAVSLARAVLCDAMVDRGTYGLTLTAKTLPNPGSSAQLMNPLSPVKRSLIPEKSVQFRAGTLPAG